jgi:hypothetical protein
LPAGFAFEEALDADRAERLASVLPNEAQRLLAAACANPETEVSGTLGPSEVGVVVVIVETLEELFVAITGATRKQIYAILTAFFPEAEVGEWTGAPIAGASVEGNRPKTTTLKTASSTARLHKRPPTHRTLRIVQPRLEEKIPFCGAFAEPSDGLEPSTPSPGGKSVRPRFSGARGLDLRHAARAANLARRFRGRTGSRRGMRVNMRILCVLVAALALATGVGTALADDSGPTPVSATSCTAQQSQQGDDEQQAAEDVSQAADEVEQEASSEQADDQAGDVEGVQAQQGAQADDDQCDDQGDDNSQGSDDSGD